MAVLRSQALQELDSKDQPSSVEEAQRTEDESAGGAKPVQKQTEAFAAADGQHPDKEGDTPASKDSAPQQPVQEGSLAPDAEKPNRAGGGAPESAPLPVPEAELSGKAQPQQATEKDVHAQTKDFRRGTAGGAAAAAAKVEAPCSAAELGRLTQDLEDTHINSGDNLAIGAEPAQACNNELRYTSAEEQDSRSAEVNKAAESSPQEAASRVDVDSGEAETTEFATPAAAASSASAEKGRILQASAL